MVFTLLHNFLIVKTLQNGLQKGTFCVVKDNLLQRKRRHFTM